jgi:two-component system sensor histidine kinase ChiS
MRDAALVFLFILCLTGTLFLESGTGRFKYISIDEGLSQSTIFCLLQDSKGFLWIGTQDGLNKYDGYTFKVFKRDPDDANSLSHNWVTAIYEDESGMIWIGTNGGGLNRFDPRREGFFRYPVRQGDPGCIHSGSIRAICQDSDGAVWVGTGSGLVKLNPEASPPNPGIEAARITSYRHDPGDPRSLKDDLVNSILEDHSGLLWIGTGGGLDRFDKETGAFIHYIHIPGQPTSLSHSGITSIYEDRAGLLWVGTNGGLNVMDRATGEFKHYRHNPADPHSLSSGWVSGIIEDRAGFLWISTMGGGLNKFNKKEETFSHYRHIPDDPYSLSFDYVNCIIEDRSRILWVGTSGKGLNKFDREDNFELYRWDPNNANSLSDSYVYAIYEDRFGILWVGTSGGGLNRLDRRTGTFTHFRHDADVPGSLSSNAVYVIFEDRGGVLWIGTGGGLDRFNRQTGTFAHFRHLTGDPASPNYNSIRSILEDSSGVLWLATAGGGLTKFDRRSGTFSRYLRIEDNPHSLSDNFVTIVYEAPTEPGVLWIGTRHGGLNRFDTRKEVFSQFKMNPRDPHSLSSNFIISLYEDRAGTLWVGTLGAGLNKRIGPRGGDEGVGFDHYTEKNGLANNSVYGILEDSGGHLWMSTNKGISRFDPERETFKNYDVKDGLQSNEFNAGAYHKSKSGEMFFGGVKGLNAFYPDDVKVNPHIPPIVITGFKIANKPVAIGADSPLRQSITWTEKIKLAYKQNVLSFEFTALDLTIPENNKYAYMMEGFEREWNYTDSDKRFAYYTNLDPGEYVFRVRGSNNDGIWNNEGAAIKITIIPPWWETWWFRVFVIMAVSVLIISVYRIRTRAIKKRSQQLQEINEALNRQIAEREMLEERVVRQEKLAVLGELAGGVGHELRNPLGAIKNTTYFLNMALDQPDLEVKESLGILEKEVANCERIIASLLDFARARAPLRRQVDIKELLQGVLSHIKIPENIEVKNRFSDSLSLILADPDQLSQVFGNIILNAVQAMPAGGELLIKSETSEPEWIAVSVTDTGGGIPPENLEKIFEPLFTSKARGIGLGMAVTRTFVEGHGGSIEVRSEVGRGSTFTVRLPMAEKE